MARVKLNELNNFLHQDIHDPKKETGSLRNITFGVVNSVPQAALGVATLGEGLVRAGIGAVDAAFDENKTLKEGLFEGITENKSLQLANKADDFMRDVFGVNSYEDLSPTEQKQQMFGELLPIIATGGSHGLIKMGNVVAKKAAKKAYKKSIEKGLSKEARKQAIKNSIGRTNLATNLLVPGVQITKNASKPRQLLEFGLQAGIPLGMNELSRATNKQEGIFGDYREDTQDPIYLIKNKQSLRGKEYLDELDPSKYEKIDLNVKKDENDLIENSLIAGTAIGGLLFGPKYINKKLINLPKISKIKKLVDFVKRETTPTQTGTDFEQSLSNSEILDISGPDRFAWRDKAQQLGLIDEETKVALARSVSQRTDSAYNTGLIQNVNGFDIDLGVSPRSVNISMMELKNSNPEAYKNLEDFIELHSKVQDAQHRLQGKIINKYNETYNRNLPIYFEEASDIEQYKTIPQDITSQFLQEQTDITGNLQKLKGLRQLIENNPVTKQIIQDISKISKGLLDLYKKGAIFDDKYLQYLQKNRTIDDLLLYKHREQPTSDKTLADITKDFLFKREPTDKFDNIFTQTRNLNKSVPTAENYLDVMEKSIKNIISGVLENTTKKQTLKAFEKSSKVRVKARAKTYDEEVFNYKAIKKTNPNAQKPVDDFEKYMDALYIGYEDLSNPAHTKHISKKSFASLLNMQRTFANTKLNEKFNQNIGKLTNAIESNKDVISFIENGKRYWYKVSRPLKDAFDVDTKMPSILYEMNRNFKNKVQGFLTGTLANPMFFLRGYKYSLDEAVTMLGSIADYAGVKGASVPKMLAEQTSAYKESQALYKANAIADDIARDLAKVTQSGSTADEMQELLRQRDKIRANINKNLLTQVQLAGGSTNKPINVPQTGRFYNLSGLSENKIMKMFCVGNTTKDRARKAYNWWKAIDHSGRGTPTLALVSHLGKTSGAIVDDIVKDRKVLDKVIAGLNKFTANTGTFGTGKGFFGNISRIHRDLFIFGDIMQQSLASKLRATHFADQGKEILNAWIDPNIRYIDFFNKIKTSMSDAAKNKFIQGTFWTVAIPTTLEYIWNHESQENRDAYYGLSNYDKAKGFVLTNALGNGTHITIPMDQELGILRSMYLSLLDTFIGGSNQQNIDPNFENSTVLGEGLARSLQIDLPPVMRGGIAQLGYRVDPSAQYTENKFINPLHNFTNSDMSQTAYEQGVFSAETIETLNAVAGNWGRLLANLVELNNKEEVSFGEALLDTGKKYLSGGKMWTDKASTYNDTAKAVYNYQRRLDLISQVANKNPQQVQIYETVKLYNRNRILPIHTKIQELRKEIRKVRTTSKLNDGTILNTSEVNDTVNSINKKLQKLYSLEYKEIQNLDNYIEQLYGKDVNFNNFMETFAQ